MGDTILIETTADEVVSIVTQGPQGPSGAEAATLTTQGDTLYRGLTTNQRLPIGTPGQVLKVNSGATAPEWANESGAVTEVNGQTGAVTLTASDVGAAPATGISPSAITGTAVVDSDARLSDSRSPLAHKNSHSVGQADFLAPSDIGAQSIFTTTTNPITGNTTITAGRALIFEVVTTSAVTANISLPSSGHQAGDVIVVRSTGPFTAGTTLTIKSGVGSTLDTITAINQAYRYTAGSSSPAGWIKVLVDTHTHAASDITSGNLTHERGGLEADVSAYSGLVKIDAGTTSAVTLTAAGEALLDDADASAQRTTLGLGNSATLNTGTTAGTVAEGNHTHADLHTRSHAITSTSDHTAGNHKVFYSNGSGEIVELALGNSGEVLTSNGATSAPSFAAASGGDTVSINASAADVLSVASGEISAVDATADKIVFWDDSASELTYLAPVGPTFDGTNLRWPVELVVACSDESTDLTTGTAKVTFRAPYAFLLTGVRASVNTAPVGSTIIVDINNGANSALSTKLSIDASEKTSTTAATAAVIDTSYDDFSDDAEITIDIDQIGSTVAGKGLKVVLSGTRA